MEDIKSDYMKEENTEIFLKMRLHSFSNSALNTVAIDNFCWMNELINFPYDAGV